MTTKTIKTILFASLIAVMVLPFGGMQSVFATHDNGAEHVQDGSHTPTGEATAEKLATLERTLDFINGELDVCKDANVLAALESLKLVVLAAIADLG